MWQKVFVIIWWYPMYSYNAIVFLMKLSWGMKRQQIRLSDNGPGVLKLWLDDFLEVSNSPAYKKRCFPSIPHSSSGSLWDSLFVDEPFSTWEIRLISKLWPHWLLNYQKFRKRKLFPVPRVFLSSEVVESSLCCRFVVYHSLLSKALNNIFA